MATVFFDLDGVLADFVRGALLHHRAVLPIGEVQWGFPSQIGFTGVDDPAFWERMDRVFWADLSPYSDGFCLLRSTEGLVGAENIGLLTSPCDTVGCVDGKRDWVARYLPDYRKRLFVGSAKHLFAGPGKILVDDHDPNADRFREAGGNTVVPPRPWNSWASSCYPCGAFDVPTVFGWLKSCVKATETVAVTGRAK